MSFWKASGGVVLIALIVTGLALAQVPPPPTNLTLLPPPPGSIAAVLDWDGSTGASGYKVYKAIDTSSRFNRIATVQHTSFTDWMVHPGHSYRYYVTAYNMSGESGPSNIVIFTPPPPPPRVTGTVNGTVTDDSTGLPIARVQIQFYRNSGMSPRVFTDSLGQYSAVLDTGTYRISASKFGYRTEWYDNSPDPQGATPVYVGAGSTVTANFGLSRIGPPPTPVRGTIAGTVVHDSTDSPIPGVRIRFYRTSGHWTARETRTDSLGMYQAQLDTGRYLVYATKYGLIPEYYDNVRNPRDATPVIVTPNATSTANFGLSPAPPPTPRPMVNVSGTVTDSVTNQPIANALVAIMRTMGNVNIIQGQNGTPGGFPNEIQYLLNHGRMHGVVWHGRTDANGNYTGRVPQGGTYIVFGGSPGYFPEWFDNKRTPMEADRLTLNNDTSGINFALTPNPLVQNSIAGRVIDPTGSGVPSHVVLYHATPNGPRPFLHTMTDSLGNYIFRYLFGSLYYLKALPVSGYAPAWYKAGAFGIQNWQDADSVRASGNVTGINIGVVPVPEGGVSILAGRVTNVRNSESTSGAVVYALVNGSIAGFDIVEASGSFRIENLAPGTYRLSVDKEGFVASNTVISEVNSSNNFQVLNLSLQITPSSPTAVRQDAGTIPTKHELMQNYPNPFNPVTNFEFRIADFGFVSLKVFDLLGREVATLVNEYMPVGSYRIEWNASGLASGVYIYRMQAGSYTETRQLVLLK